MIKKDKVIVILGPTASGKTSMAIEIAKKYNGEVISADSKQIYKYMKIGTDVPDGEFINGKYFVKGVAHHLMNIISPDKNFSLADFRKQATDICKKIITRGKLPIIVGGTGLYISSIVDNLDIPNIKPDITLREKLEKMTLDQMVKLLEEKDVRSYNVIDLKNPRRVLRALEVVLNSGESFIEQRTKSDPIFDVLQIGIMRERNEIYNRINRRIDEMVKEGLIDEIKVLLEKGYRWDMNSMSGLGYRQFKSYLNGNSTLEESVKILKRDTRRYAKRQISWFKRDKRIRWLNDNNTNEASELVKEFI